MTKAQIKAGAEKAVRENADIMICNAVEWLDEYGLIDWKTRCEIIRAISAAQKPTNPSDEG